MKEIQALLKQKTFKFLPGTSKMKKEEGWQYAPLRMIFTVKPDFRRKARLVIGGHVTDASIFETFAPTIKSENVRLIFLLTIKFLLNIVTGDINTAYLNAFTEEKIYSRAGAEFGEREGMIVIVVKALYGLKSSAHAWNIELSSTLRDMGFLQSRLDQALWYHERKDGSGYDYIAHHVDDFIIAARDANGYLEQMRSKYSITGGEVPSLYLGITTKVSPTGDMWIFQTDKYLQKAIVNVESIIGKLLSKASTPNNVDFHPEEDDTPVLDPVNRNKYQQLVGIGIWLNTIGRIDICYPLSVLSRFAHMPREGHMKMLIRIFEYL